MTNRDAQEALKAIGTALRLEKLARPRMLSQLATDPELLRVPRQVVPCLALEGRVTLLSGREKVGKSTLAGFAVARLSTGDDLLGARCTPSRVLWYAIDEPVGDTVRRLLAHGADTSRVLICDAPRTAADLELCLERDLEETPDVALVVLDTLSRVFSFSGTNPNDSNEVEPLLARIVDVFHRRNVSAILLYHTGKAGLEYRGSTAIGATVDEVLTLRRKGQGAPAQDAFDDDDGPDDGRRTLVQNGRHLRSTLHLVCIGGEYQLLDSAQPTRVRILAAVEALDALGEPFTRNDVYKSAGGRKQNTLAELRAMIAEGVVTERSGGFTVAVPMSPQSEAAFALSEPLRTQPPMVTSSGGSGEFSLWELNGNRQREPQSARDEAA